MITLFQYFNEETMIKPLTPKAVKELPYTQRIAYLNALRAQRDALRAKSERAKPPQKRFNLLAFLAGK